MSNYICGKYTLTDQSAASQLLTAFAFAKKAASEKLGLVLGYNIHDQDILDMIKVIGEASTRSESFAVTSSPTDNRSDELIVWSEVKWIGSPGSTCTNSQAHVDDVLARILRTFTHIIYEGAVDRLWVCFGDQYDTNVPQHSCALDDFVKTFWTAVRNSEDGRPLCFLISG